MIHQGNRYLNLTEMTDNANYIMGFLVSEGWTTNAICGVLGNMQTESTINPSIWQSLKEGNIWGGYGLTQWTPASKYLNWCTENNLSPSDIDSNLLRLIYEVDNNLQWINPKMTFREFTQSHLSPYDLAMLFLKHYERPKNPNQPIRGSQANYWYDVLIGGGGVRPFFPTTEGLLITSPFGWRFHPIHLEDRFHGAIDIGGNNVNHPIYATQDAIVVENKYTSYGGYTVTLEHTSDDYYSQYLHLAYSSSLSIGDRVVRGQRIGTMGTTGDSTGIHLHFAVSTTLNGWWVEEELIDPEIYLSTGFNPPNPYKSKKKSKVFLYLPKRRTVYL